MTIWVLTGSNRGLGYEFVRQLSSSADTTIIAGVRSLSKDHSELKSLQSSASGKIHILECDTGSAPSISSFASNITSTIGSGTKVDFLLNNAGINATSSDHASDLTPESLHHHIDVNVLGPALLFQQLLPHLQSGSVVMNMSSGLGSMQVSASIKPPKCATYSISKAALNSFTVQEAGEMKEKGVTVIAMDPGWVKTEMGGEGAVLEPETSIGGMLKTLKSVGLEESGKFYEYSGKEVPW